MWPNSKFPADLVKFTEEILNGELHFLRSVINWNRRIKVSFRKVYDVQSIVGETSF